MEGEMSQGIEVAVCGMRRMLVKVKEENINRKAASNPGIRAAQEVVCMH
jgi:hypothetical protein